MRIVRMLGVCPTASKEDLGLIEVEGDKVKLEGVDDELGGREARVRKSD